MAERIRSKNPEKSTGSSSGEHKEKKIPWAVIFWVVFAIVVLSLFYSNREQISKTFEEVGFRGRNLADQSNLQDTPVLFSPNELRSVQIITQNSESTAAVSPGTVPLPGEAIPGTPAGRAGAGEDPPAGQTGEGSPPESSSLNLQSNENPGQASSAAALSPGSVIFRDRTLYFINVDKDGTIVRTRVNRSLPTSDSPLTDVLSALIAGPAPDEQHMGLISLIPEGTRLMNITVRGNTAYINFSEDFQYNTYGVEGYAGAVRQIIWTATEFSNVLDVQILIENRRLDYLGEGVWIGSPLSRTML